MAAQATVRQQAVPHLLATVADAHNTTAKPQPVLPPAATGATATDAAVYSATVHAKASTYSMNNRIGLIICACHTCTVQQQ